MRTQCNPGHDASPIHDEKLTVVMLNWKRPTNVVRFASAYKAMPCVSEVVVADCGGACPPLGLPADVRHVAFDWDPGLPARLAVAGLARTEAVLLADDDIEVPGATVATLFEAWREVRWQLVGLFGRRPSPSGVYSVADVYGEVPIVLTRAVMCSRSLCCRALYHAVEMARVLGGEPFGNGEDIVLSHVAMALSGRLNHAHPLPYQNVSYDDCHAISVRYPGHKAHRTRVVAWCRENILNPDGRAHGAGTLSAALRWLSRTFTLRRHCQAADIRTETAIANQTDSQRNEAEPEVRD